jgi:PAT family beta-lactamase induction signal transducer AmpG
MAGMGFVAGLPLPLSGFTLRQWLSEGGTSLPLIGATASIGISYSLKFLWAPALDRVPVPKLLRGLGQRRGWLMIIQPLLVLACAALALCDPTRPVSLIVAAASIAFLSATQDIAVDAWRIETFPERSQGTALAAYVWGYRAALLVAGSAAITAAGFIGWHGSFLAVAALVALGPLLTLLAPSPVMPPIRRGRGGLLASLRGAVVEPLAEMLSRRGIALSLVFVLLFKLGEAMAGTMAPAFYRSLGYDRAQVGAAIGLPSLAASLAGAAVGAWLVARLGAKRALVLTGFVQMASMTLYFLLALSAGNPVLLVVKVLGEGFAEAMADAAFLTFLSSLCAPGFSATQYALLSSAAALPLRTLGNLSGILAQQLGWVAFYGITIFAALPAMLVMLALVRRSAPDRADVAEAAG